MKYVFLLLTLYSFQIHALFGGGDSEPKSIEIYEVISPHQIGSYLIRTTEFTTYSVQCGKHIGREYIKFLPHGLFRGAPRGLQITVTVPESCDEKLKEMVEYLVDRNGFAIARVTEGLEKGQSPIDFVELTPEEAESLDQAKKDFIIERGIIIQNPDRLD